MRVIRGQPASGKPPKIICSGCGKYAREAGIVVPDDAVEEGYGSGPEGDGPTQMAIVDPDESQPLCEDCCNALLKDRANFSRL